jgi:ATP-binding cassette subfamily B protein
LQEGLGGIRDVLIDGSQDTFSEIYEKADSQLRKSQAKITYISSSPRFSIEMFALVLMAIFAYQLSNNPNGINNPIPLLGTLALGAQRILPILQQIYVGYTNIKGGESYLVDVLNLLEQPLPEAHNISNKKLLFNKKIIFNNVGFYYTKKSIVLDEINFSINKGSKVGIFGKTGGGKSTILDILMGLLTSTSGTLFIDDQAIDASNVKLWQKHIAHVPQFIYLSDSTIAENIAFGISPDQIDYNRLKIAASKARLLETIELMPNGFLTSVGERGISLSGGQRQRIGIARAIYKQADVIIFDEATSALDSETESEIMQEIYNLDKNITIFIVAHRLSTLKNCNHFFEVGNKRIIEHSSFDEISFRHLNR